MALVVIIIGVEELLFVRIDNHEIVMRKRGPVGGRRILRMTTPDQHSVLQIEREREFAGAFARTT